MRANTGCSTAREFVCVYACVPRACARGAVVGLAVAPVAPLPPSTTRAEPSGERIFESLVVVGKR